MQPWKCCSMALCTFSPESMRLRLAMISPIGNPSSDAYQPPCPGSEWLLSGGVPRWLSELEKTISCGLAGFAGKKHGVSVTMDFAFEHFPDGFDWRPEHIRQDEALKNLLWALHRRQSLSPKPHLA